MRKSLKSTSAVSEEKSTVLLGKQFQILTTLSVKKDDLTVPEINSTKKKKRNNRVN